MRGEVLSFDSRTGSGLISGDDGGRYRFSGSVVERDFEKIRGGTKVDFTLTGEEATSVFPMMSQGSVGQVGEKSKLAAGLLALFLGGLGIHKFYLGYTTAGVIMLLCSVLGAIFLFVPTLVIGLIALIEAVIYLTKSDQDFHQTYEVNKKAWF